ncbi:MAG: hypothetical protein ACE15C_16545 [Phycisphaerae bacterium]
MLSLGAATMADAPTTQPASAPAMPPLTYNAISDTKYYPKPELPKLGPAGFIFKDPTFGCPMVRVSDDKTLNGDPILTPAGAAQNTWNTDSTLFVVQTGATRPIPFQFDPTTMKASRIAGLDTIPNMAGDTPFSYREKDVCYGKDARRAVIVKFNFATKKTEDVLDVTKVTGLTVQGGHLGAFGVSANDCLNLTFGGAGQNRDMYLLWYDMKTGKYHVWDSDKGTIDGKGIPNAPHFTQHASEIDRSGRFIVVTPGRGANVPWVWDVQKGTVYPFDVKPMGHHAVGYGDMVNDEHIWLYRKLDAEGIKTYVTTMEHPAGEPYFQYDSHESWNNARPDKQTPILIDTYHIKDMPDPKCVWGDEIIAVATDGSKKVWRFAHNRTWVHMPARGEGGERTMPTSRGNMAAEQPYNFWDTPRGNVSQDGRFFMFTSDWEDTLGKDRAGRFRQDVFIVKLERETTTTAPNGKP